MGDPTDQKALTPAETPYVRLESIRGPDVASRFLDVNLKSDREWFAGVSRLAAFRIPSFQTKYLDLYEKLVADQVQEFEESGNQSADHIGTAADFEIRFNREAKRVAADLSRNASPAHSDWCDGGFGIQQVRHAREGKPMRFDRAVIAALTLNRLCEHFGYGNAFAICDHEIVASVFYFANLAGRIGRLASAAGSEPTEAEIHAVIHQIAAAVDQDFDLIQALAGKDANKDTNKAAKKTGVAAYEAAATNLASFKTQWDIYCFLVAQQPDQAVPAGSLRSLIVRRRKSSKHLQALPDERIPIARRVTRQPYAWDKRYDEQEWPDSELPPRVKVDS